MSVNERSVRPDSTDERRIRNSAKIVWMSTNWPTHSACTAKPPEPMGSMQLASRTVAIQWRPAQLEVRVLVGPHVRSLGQQWVTR